MNIFREADSLRTTFVFAIFKRTSRKILYPVVISAIRQDVISSIEDMSRLNSPAAVDGPQLPDSKSIR